MSRPTISILLPFYNVERYIAACIESILSQTFRHFEIICVDDCSPDRSREIVQSILGAQQDVPWKLIVNKHNKGIAQTRRIAVEHANGDYVLCIDSDDYVAPNMLDVLNREALLHDADVVICAAKNVDPDGSVNYLVETGNNVLTGKQAVSKVLDLSLQAYCWNKLIRRTIFSRVEHPAGLIYEDIYVCVQSLALADKVRLIPNQLYFYVKRSNGLSIRFNPKVTDLFQIVDLVERSTRALGIPDYTRLLFRLKHVYAYRQIAFHIARQAPDYDAARAVLTSVRRRTRYRHLVMIFRDRRPKLAIALSLLKMHPRLFYSFVRRVE
jgi:glycosyltransferase involved in cell wall biosynthesis